MYLLLYRSSRNTDQRGKSTEETAQEDFSEMKKTSVRNDHILGSWEERRWWGCQKFMSTADWWEAATRIFPKLRKCLSEEFSRRVDSICLWAVESGRGIRETNRWLLLSLLSAALRLWLFRALTKLGVLQHWALLSSPVTSTARSCFHFGCLFILYGVISTLFSDSILGTYQPGEFIFQCHTFWPFHTVHEVLKARILKWFASPLCSGPCFVRTFYYDLSVLSGPTRHGS